MSEAPPEDSGPDEAEEPTSHVVVPTQPPDQPSGDASLDGLLARLDASDEPLPREQVVSVLRQATIARATSHSGPLPTPEDLREYSAIIDNGAERIMRMAEKEQDHRHDMNGREQSAIEIAESHDYKITRRGQTFGLIICVLIIGVSVLLTFAGHEKIAGILVALDLASLAAVFVAGRYLPGRKSAMLDASGEPGPEVGDSDDPPALPN